MRELSLFTGIGGGVLGTHLLGWTPIGYVEWNEYCQRVIAQRIKDGILPAAPIFTDVREFVQSGAADQYRGVTDVVTGGFPCQPFSVAGKRKGADDERNMWPATLDIIRIIRPRYAYLENVPGLLSTGYFHTILADLAALGMDARWGVVSAASTGAPHRRERVWLVAYTTSQQDRRIQQRGMAPDLDASATPYAICERTEGGGGEQIQRQQALPWGEDFRSIEDIIERSNIRQPLIRRMADGFPFAVDRLRAIGNGQVPLVAATAWRLLTGG
jgi:DNA (cytosine-5)-methyltransferase 1